MAIPNIEALLLPLLKQVARGPQHIGDLADAMAEEFGLSAEERASLLPSGVATRIRHRTGWARTTLKAAGLVQQPRRGIVEITDRGRELLAEGPSHLDLRTLRRFPEYVAFEGGNVASVGTDDRVAGPEAPTERVPATPEERILAAQAELDNVLRAELIDRLKVGTPTFFERVVLDLLRALGYGDGTADRLRHTGATGDGGIDGVIDEDRLGLDRIYVQAKRYADQVVAVDAIRAFSGALDDKGARKGVFVTTSTFSREATAYAERQQNKRIVLIDGERLAALMIRHGVGVRTDRTVEIRKIDLDYFEPDDA